MKFILLAMVAIAFVIGSWYVAVDVEATRTCYITKAKDIDDLAFRLQSFGGDKTVLCKASYELVDSLGVCITKGDAMLPEKFRAPLKTVVTKMLKLVRNGGKDLQVFQDGHDAVCSEFPDMMFTPPEYLTK